MGFLCAFCVCMILVEPVGLDSRNVAHGWPAVLSLAQGQTFFVIAVLSTVLSIMDSKKSVLNSIGSSVLL